MLAAGQLPDDPGVDVSKEQIARFGPFPRARDIVQNPTNLRTGEVGGQWQPGRAEETFAVTGLFQLPADLVRAGVLPDDGIVDRFAGFPIPEEGRLPLIGDANGRDVLGRDAGLFQGCADHLLGALPDLQGIVLHPAAPREDLFVFLLIVGHDGSGVVEKNKTCAGRAGIHGADKLRHLGSSPLVWRTPGFRGVRSGFRPIR